MIRPTKLPTTEFFNHAQREKHAVETTKTAKANILIFTLRNSLNKKFGIKEPALARLLLRPFSSDDVWHQELQLIKQCNMIRVKGQVDYFVDESEQIFTRIPMNS